MAGWDVRGNLCPCDRRTRIFEQSLEVGCEEMVQGLQTADIVHRRLSVDYQVWSKIGIRVQDIPGILNPDFFGCEQKTKTRP